MTAATDLRENTPPGTIWLGIAAGLSSMIPFEAMAQQAAPSAEDPVELPPVVITGEGTPANTLEATTGLGRLPGTIQDTPQIVNVVPQVVMEQQGVTTLDQALRNVPGVTVSIGEGNGGLNGDQFRIRGFDAKGDIYLDGLRDFGVYVRDSFNMDAVQVFKGPSSESFGMGTTGGAINVQSKQAHLGDAYNVEGQFGTGPLARGTFDINKQIDATTAARFNGMVHQSDIADRDHVKSDRWGFSAALGFGLGTDTTWRLNYMHQHGDRTPDYGVPIVTPPGAAVGRPITEFGVPRSFNYGKATDKDVSDVDLLTSRFSKTLNDWLTIQNDARLAYYTRDFSTSAPGCNAACSASFFGGGNPQFTYGGGNPAYQQRSWGIQNISTAVMKFNTGFLRHELIAGLDLFYQHDNRYGISTVGVPGTPGKVPPTAWMPNWGAVGSYYLTMNPNNIKRTKGTDVGLFASDRIWFTDQISILGGVRWDKYASEYNLHDATGWNQYKEDTSFASPKASLIWEPTKNQTYYISYATSASPPGQYVANAPNPLNPNQSALEPEKNKSYEIGAKIGLLDGQLGLTGALFQIEKDNARYTDPLTGDVLATGEKQRVRGIELGASGQITEEWTVNAAYSYMKSKVQTGEFTGNDVGNVPENAVSLWTTYDIAPLAKLPGKLLLGGGVFYQSGVFTASSNLYEVPANFSVDAMISYEYQNYRIALNGYNLTDELNYNASFNARAIPASGRTLLLTVGATF
jgi:catecholate siderophore receptor